MRRSWGSLLLIILLTFGRPLFAAKPKVVLFLVSGVRYEDLAAGGRLARLRNLADRGSLALLNTAFVGERTEAAAFLSLGAGQPMAAPDKTGPHLSEGGITVTYADIATEAFRADTREGNVVCHTYRRRFGQYPPLHATILHIGLPALMKAQTIASANAGAVGQIGALGDALERSGKRLSIYGGWEAAIVGMDREGAVRHTSALRSILPSELPTLLDSCDVFIYHEDKPTRTLQFAEILATLAKQRRANILIAGVSTPPMPEAPGWLIAFGPDFSAKTLLKSSESGTISTTDIAPLVANLAGASFSGGTGKTVTTEKPSGTVTGDLEKSLAVDSFLHHLPYYLLVGLTLIASVCLIGALWILAKLNRKGERR